MKKLIIVSMVLALIGIITNINSQTLKEHLIAYWSFDDGTAKDQSGNGYDGTIVNNPTVVTGVKGKGKAFHFVGKGEQYPENTDMSNIGDHILIPRIPFETIQNFTISMWVKEEGFTYVHGEAFIWFGTDLKGWLSIAHSAPNPDMTKYLRFAVGATNFIGDPLAVLFDDSWRNTWVYYCMVYENGVIKAYINGNYIGSKRQDIKIIGDRAALCRHWWDYGGEPYMTSARFTGTLDEVKIYNKALSDDEVKLDFNGEDLLSLNITASKNQICDGDTVVLDASPGFSSYLWNTNETTQSIIVNKGGLYSVTTTDQQGKQYQAKYEVNTIENNLEITYSDANTKTIDFGNINIGSNGTGTIHIKNKGTTPVSLSSILIFYKLNFKIPQSQLNTTLNPGESIDLVVNFTPDSTGSFSDTLLINDICTDYVITLKGKGIESPSTLDIFASTNAICLGDTVVLTASSGFSSYLWNTGETTQSIVVDKSGLYSVTTKDRFGNDYHADFQVNVLPVMFEVSYEGIDSNLIDYGNVYYGELKSRTIKIRNISTIPLNLNKIHLYYNISFSIPQSQFNNMLNPGEIIEMVVCYEPHKTGKFTDTVIVADNCGNHIIPLAGVCIDNLYQGESKCGTSFSMSNKNGNNKRVLHMSDPYPNPANDAINISFTGASDIDLENISVELYSVLGEKINLTASLNIRELNNNDEITINTQKINNGIYILILQQDNQIVLAKKILILK